MRLSSSLVLSVLLAGISWAAWIVPVVAQTDMRVADTALELEQRWMWAEEQLGPASDSLVAWQFSTTLDEKLHINAFSAFEHGIGWQRGVSVAALLAGNRRPQEPYLRARELVVLAHFSNGKLIDIDVLDSADPIHWQHPLYWLGAADSSASYQLLAGMLDPAGEHAINRDLIALIGLHTVNERNGLLNALFTTPQWAAYRPALLHALAQQQSTATENLLLEIAADEQSALEERLVAITALRSFSSASSLQLLLSLTEETQLHRLRREAIESLAWFPAQQVSERLNQIAWFDENRRIRNEAVESLAKLQSSSANTLLLAIARQHPSAETREEAIDSLRHQLF